MLPNLINLAIVDDHSLFRKTLKHFLSEHKNIQVSVQASNMFELFDLLKSSPADILLMDVFMPGLSGNDAIKILRSEFPDIKILILSMSTDLELISELLDAGIHGYVAKAEEPEELIRAIETVADNRLYRNMLFTEALYRSRQNNIRASRQQPRASLNDREKKILQLIWYEKSNKEIADELFLGIRSVEKIRQEIKEKTGVKSTIGLMKYAINNKIICLSSHNSNCIK